MSTHKPTPEEEIDLGSFFNQLGKLISRFFQIIGDVFKGLYHFIILSILFLRKHIIPLGLALIVGATLGFISQIYTNDTYNYSMTIQPNYQSAYHMKERVDFYNQLIKLKDTITLSELFKIDFEDSNSISHFNLFDIEDNSMIIDRYDKYIKSKDSITVNQINLKDFSKKDFSKYNSQLYLLNMSLTKPHLKQNIQKEIIEDFKNNAFLKQKHLNDITRLEDKEIQLQKVLSDIDSTRKINKKILLVSAQNKLNPNSTINFNTENEKIDTDTNLFKLYTKTLNELDTLRIEKNELLNIYNVVTPFELTSNKKNIFIRHKSISWALTFFTIVLLFFLLKTFNQYLNHYQKN